MARRKVVTTFEADAKSSGHLLTRSHEGRDQSTAGDPSPYLSLLSPLRNISLIDISFAFNCIFDGEQCHP